MKMNRSSLLLVLTATISLAGAQHAQAQTPRLWGEVSPGSKRVGFRTFEVVDTSRKAANGSSPRRIQAALWYPAKKDNTAARMTFGDYVRLASGSDVPDNMLASFKKDLAAHGNSDAVIEQLLGSPVYAVHDAAPEQAKIGVLALALDQSESPFDQAMFAEFYASQGFAVLMTTPPARVDGPPMVDTLTYYVAQDQASDIIAALDALKTDKNINTKQVGAIGRGFGSRAALLLLKDPRVTALLSINGDIGSAKSGDWLANADINMGKFKSSVMAVYETADSAVVPEFRVIQKLHNTDRTFVHMGDGFRNVDFSSIGNAKGAIPGFQYGPATPDVLGKIDFMNRLLYGWLLTYVGGDGSRFPAGLPKYIRVQRMTAGNSGSPS